MTFSTQSLEQALYSDTIPGIISGVSSTRGEDFFTAITQNLAKAINADFTFISRLNPGDDSVRTLAFCCGREPGDNFQYDLLDTPCHEVLSKEVCIYPSNICALYPKDILLQEMGIEGYIGTPLVNHRGERLGLVVALYKNRINNPDVASTLFQLFADRIAAEIENFELQRALHTSMDTLRDYRNELEHKVEERTSELVAAMQQAKSANEAKSNFLAKMSHEIRTPISGVLGMAELMSDTTLDATQQHYLEAMVGSGEMLLTVINDILDYSKIEAGRIELENIPVNIEDMIQQVTLPFKLKPKSQISLTIHIDKGLPKVVEADPVRLQQVLVNLLSNAFKFTAKGSIRLSVSSNAEQQLVFAIQDTGIGIDKEKLAQLFDPFRQADESITRQFGGTGLGLCICRGLAKMMCGDIHVESTPGKGSCFNFLLPLVASARRSTKSATQAIASTDKNIEQLHVLVAEDNAVNQIVITGLLKRHGIEAVVVENGQLALDQLTSENREYDLVFMDCEMPVMDGLTATRLIRSWEVSKGLSPITIFALTAHVLPYLINECQDAGMNGHLGKPINTERLSSILQNLVEPAH